MNKFDKILNIQNEEDESKSIAEFDSDHISGGFPSQGSPPAIARSSTENFAIKSQGTKPSKGTSSPHFRRKTHAQVIKAASSIPSRMFTLTVAI